MRRRPLHKCFGQQAAQKRTVHLHHVWKIQIEHVADRLLHQRMIPTDVENAIAAQKIEIRLVIHIVEIRALGPRIDFVETDDALRCHKGAVYVPLMQFIILAKTRSDNLLQIESHEDESFSDSRSKRKSCSRFARRSVTSLAERRRQKNCRIQNESCSSILRNLVSLNLRLSHAQPCDARSVRCNKHEPFDPLAAGLSRLCQLH